jgi:hypothetical protein
MCAWWSTRYEALRVLHEGRRFVVATARTTEGAPRVLAFPTAAMEREQARALLDRVRKAHTLVDHAWIPRATSVDVAGSMPIVEFDCDAQLDGVGLLRLMGDSNTRFPHGVGDALVCGLRMALQAAHARVDPRDGGPLCMGRLTYANVLLSPSGNVWLIGLGHNLVLDQPAGGPDPSLVCFQAPEVAAGARPSPTGDYVALLSLAHSLLHVVDLAPPLRRLLSGDGTPDGPLLKVLRWFNDKMINEVCHRRPGIEQAVHYSDVMRSLVGVQPDFEGLQRWIAARFQHHQPTAKPGRRLAVGPHCLWFSIDSGARKVLAKRATLRTMFDALVQRRVSAPGATVTIWELAEASWPGERTDPLAVPNRVYVTLNRLRDLGLRDVLERTDGGYRLSPQWEFELLGDR